MTELTANGPSIVRDDGSEVVPYIYVDSDGQVVGKAYVPVGHTVRVPDDVDMERSFPVGRGTDLAIKLTDSNANIPENPKHDPAESAMEKLEVVEIDRPV